MNITTLLGAAAATASTISFAPQAIKIIRTRDTRAISTGMYIVTVLGFALWLAYGACHAPHQAPRDLILKYDAIFRDGYDTERERRLARMIAMGLVPAGTTLPPRNDFVQPWDSLDADAKRLFIRLQGAYAAMLDHADRNVARLTAFLDTNILLYAVSRLPAEQLKRERAWSLIDAGDLALSLQVLQEFYVQATRPSRVDPLTHKQALDFMEKWRRFPVQETTLELLDAGFRMHAKHRFSFWDSMIVAAAKAQGCDVLWTEDMGDGRIVDGMRIADPFR